MSKLSILNKIGEQLQSLKRLSRTEQGKEIFTFLVFVVLATCIWFILAINDNREDVVQIPIELVNVPQEAFLLQDMPPYIEARIRDKGAALLSYDINGISPIKVNFERHSNQRDAMTINNSAIIEYARRQLRATTSINDIAPDSIRIAFTYDQGRRLPISIDADISTSPFCTLSDSIYTMPDSATIYGKTAQIARIEKLYTEEVVARNINDTTYIKARIKPIEGTRIVPDSITVVIPAEEYTTKTLSVPIIIGGVPDGYSVMTFPSHITVTCHIPMSKYSGATSKDFLIGNTFDQIQTTPGANAAIKVMGAPQYAHNVTLSVDSVEYIISQKTLSPTPQVTDSIQP